MPRLFGRTALALAAAGLVVIAGWAAVTPAVVSAAPQQTATFVPAPGGPPTLIDSYSPTWIYPGCATGRFTGVRTDAEGNVVVDAEVTICGRYKPNFSFTLAAFVPSNSRAVVVPSMLRPYNEVGPTPVQGAVPARGATGELGVCAMRSVSDRIACARITFHPGAPATMQTIAVDDPLVAKPVSYLEVVPPETPNPGSGFCGSCVNFPF